LTNTGTKSVLQKLFDRPKINKSSCEGRDLPAEASQIIRGGKIAGATTGEYAIAAGLWFALAGLIIASWIFLFETCWLTLPARWGANFCPRPVEQGGVFAAELRNRELAANLAGIKSDLVNRTPCATPRP
jgi:hypothetical protein